MRKSSLLSPRLQPGRRTIYLKRLQRSSNCLSSIYGSGVPILVCAEEGFIDAIAANHKIGSL